MRVLVVEDDLHIAQLIETILQQESYAVDLAYDGQIGLDLSKSYEYDVILLDVSLPTRDGINICQDVRSDGNQVPILLLTALDSPADRARGLNAGADDYLGKPFDPSELIARVRALFRRSHHAPTPVLGWGELRLDPLSATVTYADQTVAVTPKEYAMLELFLRNSKRVFSCNAILEHLWSYDEAPSEEAIRTHIKGIRQKLRRVGAAIDCIDTVYGIGYRLKPLVPAPHDPPATDIHSNNNTQPLMLLLLSADLAFNQTMQSAALERSWPMQTATSMSDPQQFWEVLYAAPPDLVILDVEMSGINGLELCRRVRHHRDWSRLPIIFLTAPHELSLIQEVFAIGTDDFVTKPVVEPEIILRIRHLLERQRLQQILSLTTDASKAIDTAPVGVP
jgi:DNA-binding response OmpR family regulator